MSNKKTFSFILLLIVSMFQMHAFGDDDPINKLLKDYINKINALTQGTQKADVLNLFDEKYSGNTVYVNLSGTLLRKNYVLKDLNAQLDDIIDDNNYEFKLTLDKVVFKSQKERAGIISAVVNFESSINKKVAEKGTMLMDIVAIQKNGDWKIVQNNMVRVSEAKDIGECVCYFYEKGKTKFVTEMYYPSGLEYSQELNSFHVMTKEKKRIIKSGKKEYYWDGSTGKVTYKGTLLGQSKDAKQAIQFALKNQYKETCVNTVFN